MFGPAGFDPERKRQAERCGELWEQATDLLGFIAAGAVLFAPPLALGLAITAAMGSLLGGPFRRVARDPPRRDFHLEADVPPPRVDLSLLMSPEHPPTGDGVSAVTAYLPPLALLAICQERLGARLDAMVTCLERVQGAMVLAEPVGISGDQALLFQRLRLGEAQLHASQAGRAADGMVLAAGNLLTIDGSAQLFAELEGVGAGRNQQHLNDLVEPLRAEIAAAVPIELDFTVYPPDLTSPTATQPPTVAQVFEDSHQTALVLWQAALEIKTEVEALADSIRESAEPPPAAVAG